MHIYCNICDKTIRNNSKLFTCNLCKLNSHKSCNFLCSTDSCNEIWLCVKCKHDIFPFSSCSDTSSNVNSSCPNNSVEADLHLNIEDVASVSNCKYYDCQSLNQKLSSVSSQPELSYFHLNSASLLKHLDEINLLLDSISHKFSVLAFTETRLKTSSVLPSIEGYKGFHNPMIGMAGGTALYISNSLSCFERKDLSNIMFLERNLESSFIEIPRNSCNVIIGCIYKHPTMPISDFNTLF